jgi:hypothetical protein
VNLVAADGGQLFSKHGALGDLAQLDDARITEQVSADQQAVGLATQRNARQTHSVRPREGGEPDVRVAASHSARHVSMRRKDRRARVDRVGIDALTAQLSIEMGAHTRRGRTACEPPPVDLSKTPEPNASPQRQPHLPVHEMDECEAIGPQDGRDLGSVTACCQDASPL